MSAAEGYAAVRRSRLVAIIRATDPGLLATGAKALVDEGVTTLELPLTTPGVVEAIATTVAAVGDRALVGAGTVLSVEDARRVLDAGAQFLVTPSLSIPVVEHGLAADVAVLPGVMTPTEIQTARSAGAAIVQAVPRPDPRARVPAASAGAVPRSRGGADRRRRDRRHRRLARRRSGRARGGVAAHRELPRGRRHGRAATQRPGMEGCRLVNLDVLTYGEAMGVVESERVGPLRLGGSMRMTVAGAENTVAVGVSRLGGTARWVGVVGDDEVGALVRRTLTAEGVEADGVAADPDRSTGLMLKERRTSGVTRVHYYRRHGAGACLAPEHVVEGDVRRTTWLHLSGVTPALSASAREAARHAAELAAVTGTRFCFDLNFRSALWSADEAVPVLTELAKRARPAARDPRRGRPAHRRGHRRSGCRGRRAGRSGAKDGRGETWRGRCGRVG